VSAEKLISSFAKFGLQGRIAGFANVLGNCVVATYRSASEVFYTGRSIYLTYGRFEITGRSFPYLVDSSTPTV